jgi:hypothetical protein
MSVGLIYGAITGLLRKVVIPDTDSQLPSHVGPGEVLLVASTAQYAAFAGPDAIQAHVNSATGKVPSGYRAALVDEVGNVLSIHSADPGCDHPRSGHRLIWNDAVQKDWILVGQQFVPSVPLRNKGLRPSFAPSRSLC